MSRSAFVKSAIERGVVSELLEMATGRPCACLGAVDGEPLCRCMMTSRQVRGVMRKCISKPQSKWYKLYNTTHWRSIVVDQLRSHPLCSMCEAEGRITIARVVDHVHPHDGDVNEFFLGALQSLCRSHHDTGKRLEEHRGFSSAIGADGWPLDRRHPVYGKISRAQGGIKESEDPPSPKQIGRAHV